MFEIPLRWDENGLIPVIVQDFQTDQVLMLAYMDAAALRLTHQTGQTHFWSRSRMTYWHKGETSGNFQEVVSLYVDCDSDTLLVKVKPAGPACHTGQETCFYRKLPE